MGAACGCETSNDQQPHNPSHKSNIGGIPDATWDTLNWETASKDQVNQLLSMGLDVNASLDSKGRTPTMLAVKYNRAGALQRLLEAEVSRERLNAPSDPFRGVALLQPDLTLCDSDGYTALHFGAELHWIHGSPNLVKMLIADASFAATERRLHKHCEHDRDRRRRPRRIDLLLPESGLTRRYSAFRC